MNKPTDKEIQGLGLGQRQKSWLQILFICPRQPFVTLSFDFSEYLQLGQNIKLEWDQKVHNNGLSPQTAFLTFVRFAFFGICRRAAHVSLLIPLFIFSLPFLALLHEQTNLVSRFKHLYIDANTHFVSCSF